MASPVQLPAREAEGGEVAWSGSQAWPNSQPLHRYLGGWRTSAPQGRHSGHGDGLVRHPNL